MPNLLPIPSNAFSGAAVKLDNSQIDKFLLQNTFAKNAARQFAAQKFLDQSTKGIMNQGNGIDANKVDENGNPDPKGRSDADDFGDAVKAWHDFSIGHGNELSNPRNPNYYDAQSQREQLYNNAMDIVRRSKEKVANLKAVSDRQKELEGKGMGFTDDALSSLPKAHARVLSDNYQPFDLTHPNANPKPWSQVEDASFSNEINKIHRIPGNATTTPAGDGKETVSYDNKFDELGLNQMYSAGAAKYEGHAGFKDMIDNIIKGQGATYQNLKDLYKSQYGREATHPEDIAAAYALSKNGDKGKEPVTQNISPYSQTAFGQKKTLANINAANQVSVAAQKRQNEISNPLTPTNDSEGLLQTIENNAKNGGAVQNFTINGDKHTGYPVEMNSKLVSQFTVTKNGKKYDPDSIVFDPDSKKYTALWYSKNDDGTLKKGANGAVSLSPGFSPKPLSRESVKTGLDEAFLPKKQAGSALPKATPPTATPKTPPGTHVGMLNDVGK